MDVRQQHWRPTGRLFANAALALALAASLGTGCDGGGASTPLLPDTGADAAVKSCQPGASATCFCPDGTQSGSQACSAQGELMPCQCSDDAHPPPVSSPGSADLCPQIRGSSDCRAESYGSSRVPVSMLFVIDKSRSMACNLPPLQSSSACEEQSTPTDREAPTKWSVTTQALSDAFAALPQGGAMAGLSFFSVDNGCGVNSTPAVALGAVGDGQQAAMDAALGSTHPGGQTPLVGAAILAYAHLHQEAMAPGNRFVVLMTDGAESCAPDRVGQLLDVEVQKARDANIRTFVIGAPGSEGARALLSELAYRGGTASSPDCQHDTDGDPATGNCHFDMTQTDDFAAELASALGTVETVATSCEYSVPGGFSDDVNVQYTPGTAGSGPECFPRDESKPCDEGANGWQYAQDAEGNDDTSRVVLCGDACRTVQADPAARIDILVGCDPLVVDLI